MNLMRRDTPGLPEDYYINSFISGLSDYIQAHLQCHHPYDMQKAMWLARRIEQANPPRKQYSASSYPIRRQVTFDNAKPANATPATVIQQATVKGLCYKCKEPWFPGHKKVCKLTQKTKCWHYRQYNRKLVILSILLKQIQMKRKNNNPILFLVAIIHACDARWTHS